MRSKPVGMFLITSGIMLCAAPPSQADVVDLASHERTFASPIGSFTVGNRTESVNRIAPLNQVGTSREALVSTVAYGRVDGVAGGQLKTGYHVGCAVNLLNGNVGAIPQAYAPTVNIPVIPDPGLGVAVIGPNVQVPLSVNLSPGEVKDVPVAEKDLMPGKEVQIVIRDFHIAVNQCTGPVAIRQYTYLYAKSAEVDDSGAVFGDPTWL
ncbi:MspA family porin [Nocardia acidivorans]|uniref:MspA family porin n=1 Tax=Nocardia acidivorans TaxID=404580 RepID=UPI000A432E2D|nr:MspA family porin [Nocardia acidivorans]